MPITLNRPGWLAKSAPLAVDLRQKQMAVDEQAVILAAFAESVARPGCRFLEIGSWCGDSTMVLGAVARKHRGHLYCIDWWKGNIGTQLEHIAAQEDVFSVFWKRVCDNGLDDVVIPMRGRSDDISSVLAADRFDMIYIDGDHRYETARKDIANCTRMVKDGGILCGDDCEGRPGDFDPSFLERGSTRDCLESVHCGVVLAVNQAFQDYSIDYNIWSARRASPGWTATDAEFPGVRKKRQFSPPIIDTHSVYNLVRYGRLVYAIPHALGPVDITEEGTRRMLEIPSAVSVADLRRKLDQRSKNSKRATASDARDSHTQEARLSPPVRRAAFLGFNIVEYAGAIYALHRGLGPIDLAGGGVTPEMRGVFVGSRLRHILVPVIWFRAASDLRRVAKIWKHWTNSTFGKILLVGRSRNGHSHNATQQPQWLKELREYRIVVYREMFIAIPRSLGEIEFDRIDLRTIPQIMSRTSLRDVEDAVTSAWVATLGSSEAHPIETLHEFNLVTYRGMYYAIPESLGDIRLDHADVAMMPSIIARPDFGELKDEVLDRWAHSCGEREPRMVCDASGYNIVYYESVYYGVPREWRDYRLELGDAASHPALIRKPTVVGARAEARRREAARSKRGLGRMFGFVTRRAKNP